MLVLNYIILAWWWAVTLIFLVNGVLAVSSPSRWWSARWTTKPGFMSAESIIPRIRWWASSTSQEESDWRCLLTERHRTCCVEGTRITPAAVCKLTRSARDPESAEHDIDALEDGGLLRAGGRFDLFESAEDLAGGLPGGVLGKLGVEQFVEADLQGHGEAHGHLGG